jgi:hypothetical protein
VAVPTTVVTVDAKYRAMSPRVAAKQLAVVLPIATVAMLVIPVIPVILVAGNRVAACSPSFFLVTLAAARTIAATAVATHAAKTGVAETDANQLAGPIADPIVQMVVQTVASPLVAVKLLQHVGTAESLLATVVATPVTHATLVTERPVFSTSSSAT